VRLTVLEIEELFPEHWYITDRGYARFLSLLYWTLDVSNHHL